MSQQCTRMHTIRMMKMNSFKILLNNFKIYVMKFITLYDNYVTFFIIFTMNTF